MSSNDETLYEERDGIAIIAINRAVTEPACWYFMPELNTVLRLKASPTGDF